MNEPLHGLPQRDTGADEDGEDHKQTREPLAARAPEVKREAEGNRRQRIAEVVDEVSEKRDAQRARIQVALDQRRDREKREADRYGADARARPQNRVIDKAVRVSMTMFMAVRVRPVPVVVVDVLIVEHVRVVERRVEMMTVHGGVAA